MQKLNTEAKNIVNKYIKTTSPENALDVRPKRGVQAEINKLDGIRRVLVSKNIEDKELGRLRIELEKTINVLDELRNTKGR